MDYEGTLQDVEVLVEAPRHREWEWEASPSHFL